MADLYTELITNINNTVNPIENGETVAPKAKQATKAENAVSAGNAELADRAESASKVNSTTFSNVVPDIAIMPIAKTVEINSGTNDAKFTLADGVYLVAYEAMFNTSYKRNLCGLMVVKGNKEAHCRINAPETNVFHGSTLVYRPESTNALKVVHWGDYGQTTTTASNGSVFFYKIGTLREEG